MTFIMRGPQSLIKFFSQLNCISEKNSYLKKSIQMSCLKKCYEGQLNV